MMFQCISSFDFKQEDGLNPEDLILTQDERQAEDKRKEAQSAQHNPNPISDDEEEIDASFPNNQSSIKIQQHPKDKQPQNITDIPENEEAERSENEPDLPPPHTQYRTSQRVRKRPRREDEEYDYY
jgi:hypothetical protein